YAARSGRGLPAPRHRRDRPLARPGRGGRIGGSRAHRRGQRHAGDRLLPRRGGFRRRRCGGGGRRRRPKTRPGPRRPPPGPNAVAEAAALGAECLVLVVGGLAAGSRDLVAARDMVTNGITQLLPHARACQVPLAIEPLHLMYAADRACVNTLRQALDICDALGDGVGGVVDTYHVWWDPELQTQIARAAKRILGHHICDWLVPTRDLLNDRGMMGDGVIDFRRIRAWIEAAGYTGPQEVEIFSAADWWTRDPDEVLQICIE